MYICEIEDKLRQNKIRYSYMSDLVTPCLTGRVKDNATKGDLVIEDYSGGWSPAMLRQ